jgi:hypothetical protein
MILPTGTRVVTPLGSGVVVYVKLAPPDFLEPDVYSVRLDHRAGQFIHRYQGTVIPAADVKKEVIS